ncbi:S8 family peptidase [Paenibacillus cymbidii]|uniref:S8 family peptidase n=1 Tax=Paenibacillus cymbidii TaxID=1639034 RepID=UPI001080AD53|nr:S8 family peptidase [Paenibacillus cymbidii]
MSIAKLHKLMACLSAIAIFFSMIAAGIVRAAPLNNDSARNETISQSTYNAVYEDSTTKRSHSYLIRLKDNVDSQVFMDSKKITKNKKNKFTTSNSLRVVLSDSEIAALTSDTNVLEIEQDAQVAIASIGEMRSSVNTKKKKNAEEETIPWGVKAIGGDLAAQHNFAGKAVKVGILDTGISNHEDLKVAGGISFVEGTTSYADDNGHGTHVAGTVAALDNKVGVQGMAPKVDLYAIKVLGANGSGSYSQVVQGIEWAIANKMDIINLSFGGAVNSEILHTAIKEAVRAGLIVVAAAGNQGQATESETYPALFPEVVSVGATTPSNQRAAFSSTGSNLALVAPGTEVLSTTMGGQYGELSGTSMAAPHVQERQHWYGRKTKS